MLGCNVPRTWLGGRWIGCALVFAASLPAARADDIPTVNLTASGPDRDLPVGKAFYVAGKARDTTLSVQAIVVRKGTPILRGSSGKSCTELRWSLGEFLPPKPEAGAPAAAPAPAPAPAPEKPATVEELDKGYFVLDAGTRRVRTIWVGGKGQALVTAPWQRGDLKGAQDFKLLVPGDNDFFRAGYSYCLFVFARDNVKTSVEDKVRGALDQHHEAMALCARRPDPCGYACLIPWFLERSTCEDAAIKKLESTTKQLGVKGVEGLLNAASRLRDNPRALRHMLSSLRSASDPTASVRSFLRRVDLPPFIPLAPPAGADAQVKDHAPLASALANLLAFHGGMFPQVVANQLTYTTVDGNTNVKLLGLRSDGKLVGSQDGTAKRSAALPRKLDELPLSSTVSARDLVELSQGRLRLSKHVSIKEVVAQLHDDLDAPYGTSADKLKDLTTVTERIADLAEATRRAFAASKDFVCSTRRYATDPAPPAGPERALGEWLRCAVVAATPCADLAEEWKENGIRNPPACGDNPGGWPGYKDLGETPLDVIQVAGQDLLQAHATWGAAREKLVIEQRKTTAVQSEAKIGFTQETWVGSYLTPSLGYAHVPYLDSALFYAAVQLHLYPNPVEDPQWSHGAADLVRALAIEIGFAPGAGSFGPDGRYDGPWGLPPLFAGLALHPLPYTSITGGVMLADSRATTLPQEDRGLDGFLYVGASLQANLPDLLYKKLGYGLKTSAEK